MPDGGPLASGTYKPTNIDTSDTFPAPAPAPSAATTLATFNGSDPNGTWSLFVVDDAGGDTGSMAGGWCLELATAPPTAVTLSSIDAAAAQSPAPLAGLPLGAIAAAGLSMAAAAGYAARRRAQ